MPEDSILTVLVLSCRRVELLRRTLPPLREHFATLETNLGVQWVCFDNGSLLTRSELLQLDFDLVLLSKQNLGQGPAINHLFSSVRTPYFLLLEDDWELVNPERIHFVSESIGFMAAHPDVGTVKLDTCHFLDFKDTKVYSGPYCSSESKTPFYIQNPEMLWGGFCFPPSITKTEIMRKAGACTEEQPYRRGWAESYCSAHFSRISYAAKSPEMLLFKHIGQEASSGWGDTSQ
jgi:hypothetical protein